jgi:hypothetical protein
LPRTVLRDHQATCPGPTLGAVRTRAGPLGGPARGAKPTSGSEAAVELVVETSLVEADRVLRQSNAVEPESRLVGAPTKVPLDGTGNP